MAEVLRRDIPSQDVRDPTNTKPAGESLIDPGLELPELPPTLPKLPATASPASNPAWNRSAEVVGRSVGTAVAGVRAIPRRIDGLKSRLQVVGENASITTSDIRHSAESKTAALREAAEVGLLEFADKAAAYTEDIGMRTSRKIEDLRREAWWKLNAVRRIARYRIGQLEEWKPQRPLQVILVSASAAFALGVMLRIWRSSHD